MLSTHGGNIRAVVEKYKIQEHKIIDFSSNVNPLGISPRINTAIIRGIDLLKQYPDPHCTYARQALSEYWGIGSDNFILGNGSNELIYLLPRALGCSRVLICQPAFLEYELSAKVSGAKTYFLFSHEKDDFCIDIEKLTAYVPKVDLLILSNPNNPTGNLLHKHCLLNVVEVCKKNKTYLLIDEVFMDFVDNESKLSLLRESIKTKYLLILRSFTKFFCLPGLRVGYLVTAKETVKKIIPFQPTWSVNSLAQQVVTQSLGDRSFIERTKEYLKEERYFLFNNLTGIKGIRAYYPSANFIFCKILNKKMDSRKLFLRLIKSGIVIRDCSNFKGLNRTFFRIAVKSRKDNHFLIECLRRIFHGTGKYKTLSFYH